MSQSEVDEIGVETSRVAQRAASVSAAFVAAAKAKNPTAQRLSRAERKQMSAEVNRVLRDERRREENEAAILRSTISESIGSHQEEVFDGYQPRPDEELDTWFTRQQGLAQQRHQLEHQIQTAPGLSETERGTAVGSLRSAHFMPAMSRPEPFGKPSGTEALKARVESGLSRLRTGLAAPKEALRLSRWEQMYRDKQYEYQAKWSAKYEEKAIARARQENPLLYTSTPQPDSEQTREESARHLVAEISVKDAYGWEHRVHEPDTKQEAARWVNERLDHLEVDEQAKLRVSVESDNDGKGFESVYRTEGSRQTVHAGVRQWREELDAEPQSKPRIQQQQQQQREAPPEVQQQIEQLNRQVDNLMAQNFELRDGIRSATSKVNALTDEMAAVTQQRDRYLGERDEAVQKLAVATPSKDRYGSRERIHAERAESAAGPKFESKVEASGNQHVREMVGIRIGNLPEANGHGSRPAEQEFPVIELVEEES